MNFFFKPETIAVIGATANPVKGGNAIVKNLLAGFKGGIYPVNPKYQQIEGLRCYPSLREIPVAVDLAIIFIPAVQVPAAIEECARCGVPGVMIESGGFAETGTEGRNLQQEIARIRKQTGIRIWGPNCMGLVDAINGRFFSFMDHNAVKRGFIPGRVSLIVQSGMLSASFLVDIMSNNIMGISKVCSIGNKADINENDLLSYLINDPETSVIGLYLESIAAGRRFAELCRQCTKPIVVLKGGKSPKGAAAAISHTASLAGNHRVLEGVLAQSGVFEADDFKQMMDLCRTLDAYPQRPSGSGRTAVITFSGGAGIVAADFIDQMKLSVAELAVPAKNALQAIFPDWMPPTNPVDIWPAIEKNMGTGVDVYKESVQAVLDDPGVDAVLLLAFAGNSRFTFNLAAFDAQAKKAGKPFFIWLSGRRDEAFRAQTEAMSLGIPAFPELRRTVECLSAVFRKRPSPESAVTKNEDSSRITLPPDLCRILESVHGPLDEYISKQILSVYGIPVVSEKLATNPTECLLALDSIGYPLVMKGITPGGVHKTEMGLVELGISNKETAGRTFQKLMEKMNQRGKVLLQQQAEGKIELICGLMRDPQFGVSVMLGMGGVMAEVFAETAFAMAPLFREDALDLIERFRGKKLLEGFRGTPALDREKLAAILIALGNIGLAHPRIAEVDINPLIITATGAVAVDASIILE
ncbi:MAG: succinyl-CoA synthetase subunit alpha [Smithella sp. PtaU1.Bin162]|nr:MAG: succinyl-CoA synthetase subunit alpha [Smithella sp. PtaU1.Bin162]